MNEEIKSKLTEMSSEKEVPQTTEKIRKTKHSQFIRKDIRKYYSLKRRYSRISPKQFKSIVIKQCGFIYKNYTNLFTRLIAGELDARILSSFIDALENIENGNLNQHEASYRIGLLLKKIYVDSALRKEEEQKKTKKKGGKKPLKIT